MQKALDWVSMDFLFFKLLKMGINGKKYRAIQQHPVFVSIIYIHHAWFEVNSGVRQGDSHHFLIYLLMTL